MNQFSVSSQLCSKKFSGQLKIKLGIDRQFFIKARSVCKPTYLTTMLRIVIDQIYGSKHILFDIYYNKNVSQNNFFTIWLDKV